VIKSGRMRRAGHVYRVCWGGVRERDHVEDPGVVGRKILKWICSNWDRDTDWIDRAHDMLAL